MLNKVREKVTPWVERAAMPFVRVGASPNHITVFGLLTGVLAAFLFGVNKPFLGGFAVLACGFFDVIDGAVARLTRRVTKFGGFLDSVVDRVIDSLIFIGIIFGELAVLWNQPFWFWPSLALVGSLLVSYTRARAEAAGSGKLDVGIAERAERLIILAVGGILGLTEYAVIIVAVLAFITVVQRIVEVIKRFGRPLSVYK
ncbi:MAG: CDP-alcohol phosphatidyltransferase family protein [Hadesarchaea archaeon]|nr:CDP-alcohol phosphatidyltransferase family protein [Hadesarchaea archaeon]